MERTRALDALSLNEALHYVALNLAKALTPFFQSDSYLYWPYIVSSVGIAVVAWRWLGSSGPSRRSWTDFVHEYFGPQVWGHRSAIADYTIYFANALILPALFAVVLVDEHDLAAWFAALLGAPEALHPAQPTGVGMRILFTLAFFIAYDFGRFLMHCLLHDVPVLWEFHKIHHSAEVLTPITTYRAHPLELILMAWGPVLTTGFVLIAFNAIAPGKISYYTFLGWHILFFGFNLVDNLRHSPVWLSYGPAVGRWLVSPAHHQLHHSADPKHFGCNRGFELAIWDRWYGTLLIPGRTPETLRLGLGDGSEMRYHGLAAMYVLPFWTGAHEIARAARRAVRRLSLR